MHRPEAAPWGMAVWMRVGGVAVAGTAIALLSTAVPRFLADGQSPVRVEPVAAAAAPTLPIGWVALREELHHLHGGAGLALVRVGDVIHEGADEEFAQDAACQLPAPVVGGLLELQANAWEHASRTPQGRGQVRVRTVGYVMHAGPIPTELRSTHFADRTACLLVVDGEGARRGDVIIDVNGHDQGPDCASLMTQPAPTAMRVLRAGKVVELADARVPTGVLRVPVLDRK